jgi:hypothetical protein
VRVSSGVKRPVGICNAWGDTYLSPVVLDPSSALKGCLSAPGAPPALTLNAGASLEGPWPVRGLRDVKPGAYPGASRRVSWATGF